MKKFVYYLLVLLCLITMQAQGQSEREIQGTVEDSQGEPLIGVSVMVENTTRGTVTDAEGNFRLNAATGDVLVFSYVGYERQEVAVGEQNSVNVTLEPSTTLDEVVVVGYGTARREDLTGSIASVNAAELETQAINSPIEMLRGRVAGFNTTLGASAKGNTSFDIRGRTSLTANNEPLLVVDGMIYYGDITDINPNDIQSIDVLKDASSAAVYGARAAAGVVIITTKKGTSTKPVISYNSTIGLAELGKHVKPRNVEGYLQQRQDAERRLNPNRPAGYYQNPQNLPAGVSLEQWRGYTDNTGTDEEIWLDRIGLASNEIANYLAGNSIDWFDEAYQTGLRHDQNISVSGRGESVNYYVSLGYLNNEGIVRGDQFKNFRARVNLDADVTDFLKFGVNAQFADRDESFLTANTGRARYASPLGDMYNPDGTLMWYTNGDIIAQNPLLQMDERIDYSSVNQNLLANLYAELQLPFDIKYRVNWTNRFAYSQNYLYTPAALPAGQPGGVGSRVDGKSRFWLVDNILSWDKTFGSHRFDVTLLYNAEKQTNWESAMYNENFAPNEELGYHGLDAGTLPTIDVNDWTRTGDAFMARLNYSLLDRYLLTASIRRDGFSAFGVNNPRGYFPALAFAWRLSNEEFFRSDKINDLKLRLSWGVNGNRDISPTAALSLLRTTKYHYGENTYTGVWTENMANHDLRWERTTAYNAGIDYSLFDHRISGSVDAYYMSTGDLLMYRSVPDVTGYINVIANLGEVTNKGLEMTLNSLNMQKPNFEWNSTFIFSLNRNEVKHLYGDMEDILDENGNVIGQRELDDIGNQWFIGQALDRIWDYEVLGVWQTGEEEEAKKYGKEPGDFRLRDVNGDGQLTPREDKVFQGYTLPRYRLSLNNDFRLFQNIGFSFLISANLDYDGSNNHHRHDDIAYSRANNYDYPYWTPENPRNDFARLQSAMNPAFNYWLDRSFVKLQNVSLSYSLPEELISRWRMQRCQVYVNLQNLFSITKWDAWDPETNAPTPRMYTLGLNLSL